MLEIYRHMPVWRKVEIVDDAIPHPGDSRGRLRRRLAKWAATLGVTDLLEKALKER